MSYLGVIKSLGLSSEEISKDQKKDIHRRLVERINQKYTFYLLLLLSIFATLDQFKNPIDCILTDDLQRHENYITSMCYDSSKLNTVVNPNLTVINNPRMNELLGYHAWTHLYLFFQAILFLLPGIVWTIFKLVKMEKIVDVERMIEAANDCRSGMDEELLPEVISSFDSYLSSREPPRRSKRKRHGYNYPFSLFILYKIASTFNSIYQLFTLNRLLADRSFLFGIDVLVKMWHGERFTEGTIFPHETMCNISLLGAQDTYNQYSVHCYLWINRSNQDIFMLVWFLLFLVSIMNLIDLILWLKKFLIIISQDTFTYMRNRLCIDFTQPKNAILLRGFVKDYLREDMVFLFRLLSLRKSKDRVVSKIIPNLFRLFETRQNQLLRK